MAKPPNKRRGITLGSLADSPASLGLLNAQPAVPVAPASDPTRPPAADTPGGDGGEAPLRIQEALVELRRVNADLDSRWRRQAEQLQEQLQRLEQQREQIAFHTGRLQALEQRRQTAGRVGVLLALLSLSAVAALGFHTWPRLQEVAGDLSRIGTGVAQIAPQVQSMHGDLSSLSADLGEMDSAMASFRKDVSGVRSDLGSLRQTVDTLPGTKGAVQADATRGSAAPGAPPPNATTMTNAYRVMRPVMPW